MNATRNIKSYHKNELIEEYLYVSYDKANLTYNIMLRKALSSSRKTGC